MDNNGEGISTGFVKGSAELIRTFAKDGPRETGGRKHGKSRIQTDTPENNETENQRTQKVKRK